MANKPPRLEGYPQISEVEQMVIQLYAPGTTGDVQKIQHDLQSLQRLPQGWQLADSLLASRQGSSVRFFGALTFTVKLNADWASLDEHATKHLLQRLVYWLVELVDQGEASIVISKLCSTLVLFYIRFPTVWERCIHHLIYSLHQGTPVAPDEHEKYPTTEQLLLDMDPARILAILRFTTTLAEDLSKIKTDSAKQEKYHRDEVFNVAGALSVMRRAFSGFQDHTPSEATGALILNAAFKCLQAWIGYAHDAFSNTSAGLDSLRQLIPLAVHGVAAEDSFVGAIELWTEVFSNYPLFIRGGDLPSFKPVLAAEPARSRLQSLQQGDFEADAVQFGRFLLAYGDFIMEDLVRTSNEAETHLILAMLHAMLTCPGYPEAEDVLCSQALGFWTLFGETLQDQDKGSLEYQSHAWYQAAKQQLRQAVDESWAKLRMPSPADFGSWDSDDRRGFLDYRNDVGDFLQTVYPIMGLDLVEHFVTLAVDTLRNGQWTEAEAALVALDALSDFFGQTPGEDDFLANILNVSVFESFMLYEKHIPPKTVQTFVTLIGRFADFFTRVPTALAPALNTLFSALRLPTAATPASRAIHSICSTCRASLTSELAEFLQQFHAISREHVLEASAQERVLGGVACVIQALPTDEAKMVPIAMLFEYIRQNLDACLASVESEGQELAAIKAVEILQSLKSIGKGLQEGEDVPIDLETEPSAVELWESGAGAELRQFVAHCLDRLMVRFSDRGEVIVAACAVLRIGFAERTPGPFVFSPKITTGFLLLGRYGMSGLSSLLGATCGFISAHSTDSSKWIDESVHDLLNHVAGLIEQLGHPASDPEVAQHCVEVVHKSVPRYLGILLRADFHAKLHRFLVFALACLEGHDQLPKRAASAFWATFLTIVDKPQPLQGRVDEILGRLGPDLASVLMANVAGNAARSELDMVAEPLKKMVFKQARARTWLEGALANCDIRYPHVTATEKRIFLQKLLHLRGVRGSNGVIKDFWVACRGTEFAYA